MMRPFGFALAFWLAAATTGGAQTGLPRPAELPPVDYQPDDYVDSAGCAFSRVLLGGAPFWAPRFGADGGQACGLEPSLADVAQPGERAQGFYIQAGAFGGSQIARRVRDDFVARGWGAETRPAGPLTAVFAGPFADADAAAEALTEIRASGMPDAFIFEAP